jgi:hypothetical protein
MGQPNNFSRKTRKEKKAWKETLLGCARMYNIKKFEGIAYSPSK